MADTLRTVITAEVVRIRAVDLQDGGKLVEIVALTDDDTVNIWGVKARVLEELNGLPQKGDVLDFLVNVKAKPVQGGGARLGLSFVSARPSAPQEPGA